MLEFRERELQEYRARVQRLDELVG